MEEKTDEKTLKLARRIQASQAIEGFDAPLDEVVRHIEEGREEDKGLIDSLMEQAKREGRSEVEVAKEYFEKVRGCKFSW